MIIIAWLLHWSNALLQCNYMRWTSHVLYEMDESSTLIPSSSYTLKNKIIIAWLLHWSNALLQCNYMRWTSHVLYEMDESSTLIPSSSYTLKNKIIIAWLLHWSNALLQCNYMRWTSHVLYEMDESSTLIPSSSYTKCHYLPTHINSLCPLKWNFLICLCDWLWIFSRKYMWTVLPWDIIEGKSIWFRLLTN